MGNKVTAYVAGQDVTPIIDRVAADNGAFHTEEEWVAYFNARRKRMIGAPDIYIASDAVLRNLRENCKNLLVTQPRIIYNPDDLVARVIHNFDSTIAKPKERKITIPAYDGMPLSRVLQKEKSVIYLQALFDTNDEPNVMAERLEHIADTKSDYILVYTPLKRSRETYPQRATGFGYSGHWFFISGRVYSGGLSRGVLIGSRRAAKR